MADCKPVMSITSDYTNISVDLGHHSVDMSVETCPRSLSVKMLCGGEKMEKKSMSKEKNWLAKRHWGREQGGGLLPPGSLPLSVLGSPHLPIFFPLIFPSVEPIHRPKSVNGMLNVKDQCRAEN